MSDAAAEIINKSGGIANKLADGSNLVVKSADNLYLAYDSLYYQLLHSGTATTEELNNIMAKRYEAK